MINKELAAKGYKSTKTRLSKGYISDLENGIISTDLALIPNDKKCFYSDAEEQRIGRNKKMLDIAKRAGIIISKAKLFGKKKGREILVEFEKGILEVFRCNYVELDFDTHREINPDIRYLFKGKKVIKINLKNNSAERLN